MRIVSGPATWQSVRRERPGRNAREEIAMLQTIGTTEQLKRHCDGIDTLVLAVECVSFSMEFPPRDKIRARQDRTLDAYELAWLRCRKIGYIFQTFNLIPVMTALENVTLPMIFAGMPVDEYMEKGADLLDAVGLGDRLTHKPLELSGGQQQRVAIARSLANDPDIVLADEPTGNLDLNTGKEIIELLRRLNKDKSVTVISATHDLKMLDVSDRIFWIRDGIIDRIEKRSDLALNVGTVGEEPHASGS